MVYITKSASPPPQKPLIDQRFLRYQMQSVARYILSNNRVRICLRHQREKYGTVDIFKHRSTQKAFYGGLVVCGSVWICPVCSSKISERRRLELSKAFATHRESGGQLTMLTLTFSHSKKDKLADLILAFMKSLKRLQSGKRYAKLRERLGYIGTIRALEITYGENGWHPHVHLMIVHEHMIDPANFNEIEDIYYDLWSAACAFEGLETSRKHGVKLDDAKQAEAYISKWGELKGKEVQRTWTTEMEMTKANIKKGRAGSLTPFDFLRLVVEDGDLTYEPKYKEYAEATKGLRQLYWSPGLKKYFEIDDKTDEQVAEEKVDEADRLGGLEWRDWKYILEHEYRVKLLELIEEHGYEDALKIIGIKKRFTDANGEPTEISKDDD